MTEMRGPADADNYRVKHGRFGDRFYIDPLPADEKWSATTDDEVYPSVSVVKKAVGKDWSSAMVKRLAKAPAELAAISQLDSEFERKERLNLVSEAGLGGAGSRGTAVHAHLEAKLMNRLPVYQLHDDVKPYIAVADAFLEAYQPELSAAEFVAISRRMNYDRLTKYGFAGYGGTGDAVVTIDGKQYIVDWKTRAADSEHRAYPEEAAQIAAYAKADYWIIGTDENANGAKRIDPLRLAGGLIVSIKPDSYEVFPIDLNLAFEHFTNLHHWWQSRRLETKAIGRKWAPRTSQLARPAPAHDDDEPEGRYPTVADNRRAFEALSDLSKDKARAAFREGGLNPNDPASAGLVAAILAKLKEEQPTLREMQEHRSAEKAADRPTAEELMAQRMADEGGPAPEELVGEARMRFDMVMGDEARKWTGLRVQEARDAGVSFQISQLRSLKRAHLYLALTKWAAMREKEGSLGRDEAEGNFDLRLLLNLADPENAESDAPIGVRLANLTPDQAQDLHAKVDEVVEYEDGEQSLTDPQETPE